MFLDVSCEVSTEEIMAKMLEKHSINYVLYLALKTYNYHSPEYLADKMTAIVEVDGE